MVHNASPVRGSAIDQLLCPDIAMRAYDEDGKGIGRF
jgi:hypothetical protein